MKFNDFYLIDNYLIKTLNKNEYECVIKKILEKN